MNELSPFAVLANHKLAPARTVLENSESAEMPENVPGYTQNLDLGCNAMATSSAVATTGFLTREQEIDLAYQLHTGQITQEQAAAIRANTGAVVNNVSAKQNQNFVVIPKVIPKRLGLIDDVPDPVIQMERKPFKGFVNPLLSNPNAEVVLELENGDVVVRNPITTSTISCPDAESLTLDRFDMVEYTPEHPKGIVFRTYSSFEAARIDHFPQVLGVPENLGDRQISKMESLIRGVIFRLETNDGTVVDQFYTLHEARVAANHVINHPTKETCPRDTYNKGKQLAPGKKGK